MNDNDFRRATRTWVLSFVLCAGLVVVAIWQVDRPFALWAHATTRGNPVLIGLSAIPDPLFALGWPVLIVAGGLLWWRGRFDGWVATAWLCSISVVLAGAIKNGLKIVAGRTWTETWINHNPSFIADGVFGFHWFAGTDKAYAAFPSGHLAVVSACCTVLWLRHPRYRWVYALAVLLTAVGQLGANFHWISDVLAGTYVGVATGCASLYLARTIGRRVGRRLSRAAGG